VSDLICVIYFAAFCHRLPACTARKNALASRMVEGTGGVIASGTDSPRGGRGAASSEQRKPGAAAIAAETAAAGGNRSGASSGSSSGGSGTAAIASRVNSRLQQEMQLARLEEQLRQERELRLEVTVPLQEQVKQLCALLLRMQQRGSGVGDGGGGGGGGGGDAGDGEEKSATL
jgi:hypothetical protein